MLYKPKYCCECGEKAERAGWRLWTSRRFCEECEPDFKVKELALKIFSVAVVVISSLYIFGSFLKSSEKSSSMVTTRMPIASSKELPNSRNGQNSANANTNQAERSETSPAAENLSTQVTKSVENQSSANLIADKTSQNSTGEPVYFCGAQTKKGTYCTRRVKGGGRCWQHTGQEAMLPKGKLVVSR